MSSNTNGSPKETENEDNNGATAFPLQILDDALSLSVISSNQHSTPITSQEAEILCGGEGELEGIECKDDEGSLPSPDDESEHPQNDSGK